MDPIEFSGLFKDLMIHLYDYTVLETHPLTTRIDVPPDYKGSRGEFLKALILEEIERFKVEGKDPAIHAVEWRPYQILKSRFVEGSDMRALSRRFSLSERQLRRDSNRAVLALSARVREKLESLQDQATQTTEKDREDLQTFDIHLEALDLSSLVQGVAAVFESRIRAEGHQLDMCTEEEPVQVMADRIITRQVLINLISYFLNFSCMEQIEIKISKIEKNAKVHICSTLKEAWTQEDESDHADLLDPAFYWSQRIGSVVEERHPRQGELGIIELEFSLPLVCERIILVVDDQQPTHQMFHRFLSRSPYQIVGVKDPEEVLEQARRLQPVLITLDVMMPKVDGWELLQALKTNVDTRDIPILVCSAWEEPELALSLGAFGFLKKPIRQRDLLDALARLERKSGDTLA
jgi:CheY-like chemotaxis protein